jgi:hypothetical protein
MGLPPTEETPGPWLLGAPEYCRCPTKVQVSRGGEDGGRTRGTPNKVQALFRTALEDAPLADLRPRPPFLGR